MTCALALSSNLSTSKFAGPFRLVQRIKSLHRGAVTRRNQSDVIYSRVTNVPVAFNPFYDDLVIAVTRWYIDSASEPLVTLFADYLFDRLQLAENL